MIGVVFFFEDMTRNVYSGDVDADIDIWRLMAKAWGATDLVMVDTTLNGGGAAYAHNDAEIAFLRVTDLAAAEARWPTVPWVYLEEATTLAARGVAGTALPLLHHPSPDAIYVAGPDSRTPDMIAGREGKTWVTIPVARAGALWSLPAAAAVLSHRYLTSL